MSTHVLRSECGNYYAVRGPSYEDSWYRLWDREGKYLGRATYWSNRFTSTRVGFETGFGKIAARFSYPQFPSWFRRRWVECWDCAIEEAAALIREHEAEVLVAFKVGLSCHHCLGFRATSSQLSAVDKSMTAKGWRFETRKKSWYWDIGCPDAARTWPRYAVELEPVPDVMEKVG